MRSRFVPYIVSIVPVALILPPWAGVIVYLSSDSYPIELFSAFSAATTALASSLLWARAANDENDKNANSAAAALSATAAAFAVGAMSIPEKIVESAPEAANYLHVGGFLWGWILLFLAVEGTWRRHLR